MTVYLADVDLFTVTSNAGVAIFVAAVVAVTGYAAAAWRANRARDRKIDRILQLFEGEAADPLAGRPATLGVLGQINELRLAVASLSVRVTELEHTINMREGRHE